MKNSAQECQHELISLPDFDLEKSLTMTVEQIRKNFPRKEEVCSNCGAFVVKYFSYEHYVAGDW